MHGFSGRQAQQAAWRNGQAALGNVSSEPTKDGGAQAKHAEAEVAHDLVEAAPGS